MTSIKLFTFCILVFQFSHSALALNWKGIFLAGDHSIENFDNGRLDLTEMFSQKGNLTSVQLSSSNKHIGTNGVLAANPENIYLAFEKTTPQNGEGCFIHMTSHGDPTQGFYLSLGWTLPAAALNKMVNDTCGDAPIVVLVSACYSGQFINPGIHGPNRIIMTAARADRPSFGCSADTEYTYWDGCLLTEGPKSRTWKELYENVKVCITQKESALGARPSEPQAFFGENTFDWEILH